MLSPISDHAKQLASDVCDAHGKATWRGQSGLGHMDGTPGAGEHDLTQHNIKKLQHVQAQHEPDGTSAGLIKPF